MADPEIFLRAGIPAQSGDTGLFFTGSANIHCRSPPRAFESPTSNTRRSFMSFDTTSCGKRVRQLRKQRNLTQLALCEKLNISETFLRKIESGARSASIDLYIEIAAFFRVSLDYLILGTEQSAGPLKSKIRTVIELLQEIDQSI